MRKLSTSLALACLLFWSPAPVLADDSDIFVVDSVDPNVVILLDSSGSMNSEINGVDKILIAKKVLKDLLRDNTDIQFGIFRFTAAADGGELISELGNPHEYAAALIDNVNARGGTPLGLATLDIKEYYEGLHLGCTETLPELEEIVGPTPYACGDCDPCKECVGDACRDCDCKDCDLPLEEVQEGTCENCVCEEWKDGGIEGKHCECDCYDPIDLMMAGTPVTCLDCDPCKDCTGDTCTDCDCKECDWPLIEANDTVCTELVCEEWRNGGIEGKHCVGECFDPDGGGATGPTYECRDCDECKVCEDGNCAECKCDDCDAPVFEIDKELCIDCECDEWKGAGKEGKHCDCQCYDPFNGIIEWSIPDEDLVICDTPVEKYCQSNFAILITDGLPTTDDYPTQVVDAARELFTGDFSIVDGDQNVVVHTVGFNVPQGKTLLTNAATAGGGFFYTADNSAQLQVALEAALQAINTGTYSFTKPQIPSTSVDGGDKAYIAAFNPATNRAFWRGQLRAYTKTVDGRVPVDADGLPLESALAWDAGKLLAAKAASTRKIYTVKSGTREAFTTSNNDIDADLLGLIANNEVDPLIDWIRGVDTYDADQDGDITEGREWKLGDIYHSNPTLVYPPPLFSTDSTYKAFKTANAGRTTILLAGANDGMLHAFRESDGQELWGFIPPDLLDKLQLLPERTSTHPFYVDGSPVVADVKTNGSWKTIVVFGERRGGASYHALNITDTTDPAYLWSFTDPRIAETWSDPVIGKVRMADNTDKWVAFVGGGYDTDDNNAHGDAFFVIDLANGSVLWEYSNTGSGDSAYMNFSIVASPSPVEIDGNGYIDYVYVGDVGGQLWKFDVSAKATLTSGKVDNWTGMRLFAADSSQTNPPPSGEYSPKQAMYAPPSVALDEKGKMWVMVGTGNRNVPLENSQNRFYAIKDDRGMANDQALTESDLVSAETTDNPVHGWYLPLAATEKVFSKSESFDSIVYFSTFTVESGDDCNPSGRSRLYGVKMGSGHAAFDWDTGDHLESTDGTEERAKIVGDGIPAGPTVTLGGGTAAVTVSTTAEEISEDTFDSQPTKRVRYWREVR